MAESISTKSLIEKLGVKPGARISLLGVDDSLFAADLVRAGADVTRRRRRGSDLIFLGIEDTGELGQLAEMEPYMERNGAVWAVYPKGRNDPREVDVIAAGVGAGLVDNKVVRFSETHTALRFVIPVARR